MQVKILEEPKSAAMSTRCWPMCRAENVAKTASSRRCSRIATHTVDGTGFCRQHAGQLALGYLAASTAFCVDE